MARFGQYETDRPLYRTGFNAIYLCQSGTKGSPRHVVKVYQPSVTVQDEKRAAAQSEAFLDSAGVQQKAAGEGARYWAPIHESGTSSEGVFYVTDHYELSAQQLIDGRANLNAAGLCHIVESVVMGLLALKRACGRPHGNLTFTNILISGRRALGKEKIVLADPCPGSQLDEDTHWKMDLRQLGTLIHQLVMHRNPPLVAGYQAPDSPEWQRLGRRADAWRDLCNRLLTMDVGAEPITLDELPARLPGVAGRGRNRIVKAVACLCLVALLAVLYRPAMRLAMDILLPPDPEEARMAYLKCSEARTWLPPLWYKLAEKVPGIDRQRYAHWRKEDESLKKLVGLIETYGEPFKVSETDLDLSETPPEKLATSRGYQRDVIRANDAREQIEALLSEGQAGWSPPKELAGRAAGLREAKCESMAGYMDTLLGSIRRRHERLAECIDDVLYLKNNWHTVQYAELEPNAVTLDASLAEPVRDAKDFVDRLHRLPDHYRAQISAFDDLLAADKQVRSVLQEVIASGDTEAEALQTRLETAVEPRIAQVRSTPFTKGNERRLTDECKVVRNLVEEIEQQIKGADQWFDEWRAQAAGGIGSSPAVNRAFVARLDAWTGQDRDAFAAKYKGRWSDLRLLRNKVVQTQDNLRRLDGGLPKTITSEAAPAPWSSAICEYYAGTRREDLIREITDKLAREELFPDPNGYPDDCSRLMGWPGQAIALMRDFADIERGLDHCHLLDERPAGARADIQSLYLDPNNRWIREEGPVGQALEPIITRVVDLERIRDSVGDIDALLARAGTSPQPEARYAAWRKLVSLPLVEEKWQEEETVRGQLKTELESRRGDGRLADARWMELTQEIDRTGELRERRFRDISIDRLAERVAAKAEGTGIVFLQQLGRFKPANDAELSEMRAFHARLKSTWDNDVNSADWPAQYDLGQFDKDRPAQVNTAVVAAWLSEMPQYRRTEDPRNTSQWDGNRKELDDSIAEGLKDMADDADVTTQLTKAKTGLDALDGQFGTIRDLPAIEKYRAQVAGSSDLWRQLKEMEDRVNSLVHPAYKHLTYSKGLAMFKPARGLDRFEPVDPCLAPFTRAGLRDDFFSVIDRRDKQNAGWPRFIRAAADNTAVLVFVPGSGQTPPFYISRREITNGQYARFLKAAPPGDFEELVRDTLFKTTHRYPSAIDPDSYVVADPNRADHPVAWVTYDGAAKYAQWLGSPATLPKASWHRRAVEYSHPGAARHADPALYHVRTTAWGKALREYNEKCTSGGDDILDSVAEKVPAPVGAVHEFGRFTLGQPLAEPIMQVEPGIYPSAWPMPSHSVSGLTIHDLIGNVWEWCEDADGSPVICGGSCLSPVENIGPDTVGTPPRRGAECDLGFRVAIQCPQ